MADVSPTVLEAVGEVGADAARRARRLSFSRLRCAWAQARTAMPASVEASEPATTPIRTCAWSAASPSGKASWPMNRLMVKPMPQSSDRP